MVRCWAFRSGVPFAVGVDEPAVVDRALRILRTGDWNPHVFDYPTLVIYFHAVVAGLVFLAGEAAGAWRAVADIDLAWVYAACRLAAAAVGVATVWIAYRLALDLGGRATGIGAAALLAVFPMHVRESHFVLTDVPAAALVTLAIWLAVRAGDCPSLRRWAAAGAVAGLAAGAKYNGAVALVPVVLAGLVHEHDWRRRARAVTVATLAAAAAYVVAAPYTLLDATQFLAGFDAQMARFSGGRAPGAEAIWLVYLKHLALNGAGWLPAAAIGVVVLAARPDRARAVAPLGFLAAYGYVLATHTLVFGRYALPLVPLLCVCAAIGVVGVLDVMAGRLSIRPAAARTVAAALLLAVAVTFAMRTAAWLDEFAGPDTRRSAAEWMQAALPAGARVAVDVSGPTYLGAAGFRVTAVPRLTGDDAWYRRHRIAYAVLAGAARNPPLRRAGERSKLRRATRAGDRKSASSTLGGTRRQSRHSVSDAPSERDLPGMGATAGPWPAPAAEPSRCSQRHTAFADGRRKLRHPRETRCRGTSTADGGAEKRCSWNEGANP